MEIQNENEKRKRKKKYTLHKFMRIAHQSINQNHIRTHNTHKTNKQQTIWLGNESVFNNFKQQ